MDVTFARNHDRLEGGNLTCIIGLKRDGKVYMGADGRYLDGWHIHRSPNPKIFRVGDMLIGTSGSQRLSDILQYNLSQDIYELGYGPAEFIARQVIPEMRGCLQANGYENIEGSAIMIAYAGCLFIVGEDFSLSEIAEYEAIGAGASYALGYMYAMRREIFSPETLLERALECAAHFSASCARPFVVEKL